MADASDPDPSVCGYACRMIDAEPGLPTDAASPEEFDRLFAESAGPYLRVYVTARLRERGARDDASVDAVLEDLYAGLLATEVFVNGGDRQRFFGRMYAAVDAALPHLGRAALRRPLPAELAARARRFATLVGEGWHRGFDDYVTALEALEPRAREAIYLRQFHALSVHEIGQRLGMSKDQARLFVAAARERIRR